MFDVNCALCRTFITEKSQERTNGGADIISVAEMISDTELVYGISGVYTLKKNLHLHKGDSICNNCIKEHGDSIEPSKTIHCEYCSELYQPVWDDLDSKGFGCASYVQEIDGKLTLSGGWGSNHDLAVYDVVVPVVKPGDNVCDKCIDLFVREGSLVQNKDEPVF